MALTFPPTFASSITKLPLNLRSRALRKISANANAAGGSKRQTNGRPRQDSMRRLITTLGVYPVESNVTASKAASVGGSRPANIDTNAGTPATAAVATIPPIPPPLIPVTWAAAGSKTLTAATTYGSGEAVITV